MNKNHDARSRASLREAAHRTVRAVLVLTFVLNGLLGGFLPGMKTKVARAATQSDTSLDFDTGDEANFIQENATHTRFTTDNKVGLGQDTTVGGVTTVSSVISSGAYSTVTDDLQVPATGVISSWRVYSVNDTTLKLKAYQRNGSNNYTLRADSTARSVTAASVNGPFTESMSVVAGDRIGLYGAYNPYRTTGGLSFFGWNNGGDFTGTGSFANSNGAFSHPNVEFTLTQFSTAQPYYVTTSDDSQLTTKHWTQVNSIAITQTTPANTSIKYLVSFDDRSTWKYWDGDSWEASSLDDLQTDGMSEATLEGLSSANWAASGGFTANSTLTIDIAMDFASTDNTVGPSVDQITFSYETSTDTTLDFDQADEGDYIQEDATNGTDFSASGTALLHLMPGANQLYDLSGGTGGQSGQTTYTAPDGTTAVSSAPTWNNSNFYYMQYMFDGSGLTGTPTTTQYWLTSSSGNQTLTFTLPDQTELDYVRVYPYTRADAWSSYSIAVSTNASSWTFVAGSGNTSTGVGTSFTHTSQGSAGDNFDYQIDGTYKYVKFTLTQQGSFGVTLNEIQIYESVDAYPLTGYYVTTSDANQIDASDWTVMGKVRMDQTLPAGTMLRYLFSFDDRSTWKYWNGSSWASSALGSIGTNGMSATATQALGYDDWEASGGFQPGLTQTVDVAVQLKTADQFATPEISLITFEYSDAAPSGTGCHFDPGTSDVNTCVRIVQERLKKAVQTDITMTTTTTHGLTAGGLVRMIFPAGYDLSSIVVNDLDLAVGDSGYCDSANFSDKTLAASPSGSTWGAAVSGQTLTFTSGTDPIPGDRCVKVEIGTVATYGAAGSNKVTNPSTAGSYKIRVLIGNGTDEGDWGVTINEEDQVNVEGAVDPYMTFEIGATHESCDTANAIAGGAVDFGVIPTSGSYRASKAATTFLSGLTGTVNHICGRVSTNATNGYVMTVKSANGALKSTANPTHSIPDVVQAGPAYAVTMAAGTESYGLCVGSASNEIGSGTTTPAGNSATGTAPFNFTCTNSVTAGEKVGALTTNANQVLSAAGPVQNGWSTLYLKAAANPLTEAHSDYQDTLTFIATATF